MRWEENNYSRGFVGGLCGTRFSRMDGERGGRKHTRVTHSPRGALPLTFPHSLQYIYKIIHARTETQIFSPSRRNMLPATDCPAKCLSSEKVPHPPASYNTCCRTSLEVETPPIFSILLQYTGKSCFRTIIAR